MLQVKALFSLSFRYVHTAQPAVIIQVFPIPFGPSFAFSAAVSNFYVSLSQVVTFFIFKVLLLLLPP